METLTLKLATKRILPVAISALAVFSLLTFSSCKDEPAPPTPVETLKANIVGKTWTLQSVTVDGVDKSSLFAGMKISFTATGYSVTGPTPVWPASGTWTVNEAATTLTRNDGLEVQIEATASSVTLRLNWTTTTLGPGKTGSVAGQHVFVFGN